MVEWGHRLVAILLPPDWEYSEQWSVPVLLDCPTIAGSDRGTGGGD